MNRLIFKIMTAMMLCVATSACSDGDEPIPDNYYVRYTAIGAPDQEMNVYFTTETGSSTLIQASMPDGKLQYVFGPVGKGFTAGVTASYAGGGPVWFLSIEVAKGSDPFVLKRKGYANSSYSLEYTIE
ncbi:MAG: hypothetical protein K2M97_06055 [Muribaculaceae bacterium]|nr:hypothetical protein [Muribaculaceae bacterium]